MKGAWDSIHVIEVKDAVKGNSHYKLTTTIMLSIETATEVTGKVSLAGSMTRQVEKDAPVSNENPHYVNIGRLVEDLENKIREASAALYFAKTKEVGDLLRNALGSSEVEKRKNEANKINAALSAKRA